MSNYEYPKDHSDIDFKIEIDNVVNQEESISRTRSYILPVASPIGEGPEISLSDWATQYRTVIPECFQDLIASITDSVPEGISDIKVYGGEKITVHVTVMSEEHLEGLDEAIVEVLEEYCARFYFEARYGGWDEELNEANDTLKELLSW